MQRALAGNLANLGTETAFAVSDMAAAQRRRGRRVFPFHLGDINLPPPRAIIDAAAAAVSAGKNGYCPGAGIPLLREQLARVIGEERGVSYAAENIAVQPGGKPVIGKFLAAVMNPGDAVLYPAPGFPIYESQIRYQGGAPAPYFYRAAGGGGFALDLDSMRDAVTERTRALIFNNYHNPTGAAATEAELDAVAELARRHDLWLLVDDAYFNIRYDGEPARSILPRDVAAQSVSLFTCSKQFAMTGWRLGAAVGPAAVIDAVARMNTNMESCTTHFIQHAVGEALRAGDIDNAYILKELKARRDLLTARINAIDGMRARAPASGFYLYCDAGDIMRRKGFADADSLMRATLEETGVSFCTGAHFGEDAKKTTHIRFAFSGISTEDIDAGLTALKDYFER